jgi:uncharacterized protein YecE (DUF72 family)
MGKRISRWIRIHDKIPNINYTLYQIQEKRSHRRFLQNILSTRKKIWLCSISITFYSKYEKKFLERIVTSLDYNFKNVIEFRDSSSWNKQVYLTFQKNNIAFCNLCSPLKVIKEREIHHTTNDLYIRFHGIKKWYEYDYNKKELKFWVNKIIKFNPENLLVYFNNTISVYNCIQFLDLLRIR